MAQIPENILRRSAEARAKKEGRPVDEILSEMKGEAPAADQPPEPVSVPPATDMAPAEPPPTPAAAPAPVATATAVAVVEDDIATQSEADLNGATSERLLTVIRAGDVQRIRSAPTDRVNVWPHLLAIEFVALLVVLTLLITLAIFLDAPLLEFANFNEQPNPSKAPWYFLGLQELLSYFDPQIAGIIIPTFGAIAIAIIPYIDKNPSVRPSHRKFAIMLFTFFIMAAAVLTILGSFFRGPGFNFTFPWEDGIFFDDLKSLLE
ncbi:MAG: menaquinol-cytochrome c reductase cytochrome b subunit [Acidimicrobiia bacterium]